MKKDQRIDEIDSEVKELKDKIWELEKEKRELKGIKGSFGIRGCPNTK